MRRSNLPSVKGNLVITRSNVRSHHPPNVSRSWSSRENRVVTEQRLARSVGDLDREKRVLEWCKKNKVNMVRKLPKLDPSILTTRGVDMNKFMTFVEEAPIDEKRTKPYVTTKGRKNSAKVDCKYCEYCQREMPLNKLPRTRSTSFTSPFECEHCGASNNLDETDDNIPNNFTTDSESTSIVTETVDDTIRKGTDVTDHRTFNETSKKSEKTTEDSNLAMDHEEMDIFWRNDASEYFEQVDNTEDEMSHLNIQDEQTVFLTEASVLMANKRQVKMAWDDEDSTKFAEISRTVAGDDGVMEEDVRRNEEIQRYSSKSDVRTPGVCLFQENVPASDMNVRVHSRIQHSENNGKHSGEIHSEYNTSVGELSKDNSAMRSPIANRSVGLTRVALMRISRANRSRSNSPLGTRQKDKTPEHQGQSSRTDSYNSYSFLDAVSPEIKSFHEYKESEKEDEKRKC